MEEATFSSYLLGRLATLEMRLRADLQPPAPAEPVPEPVVPFDPEKPPTDYNERSQWYNDHLERLAGPVKPPAAKAAPEPPPKTLSKSSATFQRQFSKWAEAVADGRTEIVE